MFDGIKRFFGMSAPINRDPSDDFWFTDIGQGTAAGVRVSHAKALTLSVVYACVKVISETASSLPLITYRKLANGDKERISQHPLHTLLHEAPNSEHTSMEFREMLTAWAAMRGTACAEIIDEPRRAQIKELIPIHPDHIRVLKQDGRWRFLITEPGTPQRWIERDSMFVLRAMVCKPGSIEGMDPISVERETLGAALAVNDYSSRFFKNDGTPGGGTLTIPGEFKDDESRFNFLKAWRRATSGSNRHKIQLLEKGMTYTPPGMTNRNAQFLETRKYHDVDIARIFRVPPHKVGILDRATFSNIEQQSIEFVVDTMQPWLVRWEQAIKRDLIFRRDIFAEHNVNGLLRGDIKSRFQAYAIGRTWGWYSANDILRFENQNSIGEGGDIYLQPLNMMPAGQPGEPSLQGQPEPAPADEQPKSNGAKRPTIN